MRCRATCSKRKTIKGETKGRLKKEKEKEEKRKGGKNEEENVHRKLKRSKSAGRVSTDNRDRRRGREEKRGFIIDVAWTGGMITRVCLRN